MKLGCNQGEIKGIQVEARLKLGRVKDPETPSGGVSQPFIEASRAPVLRAELVRAG